MRMPVVFIGHGSPMNAISDNSYTGDMKTLSEKLPRPAAILCVSAHWLSTGTFVCCEKEPGIIYDFYGFPPELYAVKYPVKGAPLYAKKTLGLLDGYGIKCGKRGIDHGTWTVLKHMYPKADIPVFQLSVDYSKPAQYHYDMAKSLAPLRDEGVLILGSGNMVHNLGNFARESNAKPFEWAVEFDKKLKELLADKNHKELINYENLGGNAELAVPTNDHYLPMMYPLALAGKEPITFVHESIQNGSVSMRSFAAGM
ncbi:MAG: 4,5-DOPA dioxygenase extradiol [Spirochaetia bacterium]|nr:4,5-DOPA dioxygenase extradiol [Spirochaetia bacterium]